MDMETESGLLVELLDIRTLVVLPFHTIRSLASAVWRGDYVCNGCGGGDA